MKSRPDAIIFDLDGTLVDSERATFEIARPIISRYLGRQVTDQELNSLKGKAWKYALDEWFPGKGKYAYEEIVTRWGLEDPDVFPYDGVIQLLADLKQKGIRMGIASSRETAYVNSILSNLSIKGFFDAVVGQNDTERHKPFPDPLLLVVTRMNLERSSCIYVGDQPWDIQASRAAGMYAGAAIWGEGEIELLSASAPDYVFSKPTDILDLFPTGSRM